MFDNPTTYRRHLIIRTAVPAVAAIVCVAIGCAVIAAGHTAAAIAVAGVALLCLFPALTAWDVLRGEIVRPRAVNLYVPLTDDQRRTVNRAVAATINLNTAELDALDAAFTEITDNDWFGRLYVRVLLTAEWSGRLYSDDTDRFGAEALEAVDDCPAARALVLGLLVADLAHPDDVGVMLAPWTHAGLPIPTDTGRVTS